MQTEVLAHKHIQSFAKVAAFTGNPPGKQLQVRADVIGLLVNKSAL